MFTTKWSTSERKYDVRVDRNVKVRMPDDTAVHCGHGPSTTIGVERVENPFLNGEIRICPDLPL